MVENRQPPEPYGLPGNIYGLPCTQCQFESVGEEEDYEDSRELSPERSVLAGEGASPTSYIRQTDRNVFYGPIAAMLNGEIQQASSVPPRSHNDLNSPDFVYAPSSMNIYDHYIPNIHGGPYLQRGAFQIVGWRVPPFNHFARQIGASAAAVALLPKKKADKSMLGPDGEAECLVCMETFVLDIDLTGLRCTHWFHSECIGRWLGEHDSCPTCRQSIMPKASDSADQTDS